MKGNRITMLSLALAGLAAAAQSAQATDGYFAHGYGMKSLGMGGSGVALAQEPFDFRRYASDDHWDYNTIRLSAWDADAEPELTDLVKRMAGSGRFTYDVLGYRVHGGAYISGGGGIVSPAGYGSPFYDPYWSCLACGYGVRQSGVNIRVGIGGGWGPYEPWGRDGPPGHATSPSHPHGHRSRQWGGLTPRC